MGPETSYSDGIKISVKIGGSLNILPDGVF